MGIFFRFLAWVIANIERWGRAVARHIDRIIRWINSNAKRIIVWINAGISFGTIVEWILRILGIG